jgi:myo-inositol-1-phosphate synthase
MLVGWGGNNGSTVTACVLANKIKLKWKTKEGIKEANYYGSLTQASTTSLGLGPDGKDVYVPVKDLLPMLEPNDIEFDGWDINSANLAEACERAAVLDVQIQDALRPRLAKLKPRPSIYCLDFIAANQGERADNVLKGAGEIQTIRCKHFHGSKFLRI